LARQTATAAENTANIRPLITASTALEYGGHISHNDSNIYGLVTLQAPAAILSSDCESSVQSRIPIDLVCVVDQSGSMSGNKIQLLKETLVYLTTQLNEFDRLAIVAFNSSAYDCSHGLKRMNQQK
jgi:Mg-chelatase subunit ChlD